MARKLTGKKRLAQLEDEIKGRGVHLAYERLQFAGLKLKSGLCWFRGKYYLFVDRYQNVAGRIDLLQAALEEYDELAAAGRLENPGPQETGAQGDGVEQPAGPVEQVP